ncbi:type I-U CRISPR-associated protein Csb2 [Maioricimonas sp. JC845]|uniref:type I-G CRISPR-associated protein Csb2 n=1 Tax=Maioricimonas sp. JC845 TaxID=3232138 RepID=UPI0034583F25
MSDALVISVRFHEGWYHGAGGAPSPARLFQALVAGVGISGPLDDETIELLKWLENLDPPITCSPHTLSQKSYTAYVPNNEADSCNGYQELIKRTGKRIAPLVFDPRVPFVFAWRLADEVATETARKVVSIAHRVYQLGRCIDTAWAWAELLSEDELRDHLTGYPGVVRYPSAGLGDVDCPTSGSLASLIRRHEAGAHQFARTADGKGQTFRQQPKPRWKKVSYEGTASRLLFELRRPDDSGFAPWPLERSSALVEQIRDATAERLRRAFQDRVPDIDRVLIGRKPDGENSGPSSARVRIIPLASIGHPQADMQIRRIVVEVPGECPLHAEDVAWAISGLRLNHSVFNEPIDLTPSDDRAPLGHYGVPKGGYIWRSVTPVALVKAARRRIDPVRVKSDDNQKKSGDEKYTEHSRASFAIAQALRHANISAKVSSLRLQREPFDLRGVRVEPFAERTRFSKHCLWHVEIEFESLVCGPLVIGDGRFLGLGVMRPMAPKGRPQSPSRHPTVARFAVAGNVLPLLTDALFIGERIRTAVMSCSQKHLQEVTGNEDVDAAEVFSGKLPDGTPKTGHVHAHYLPEARQADRRISYVTVFAQDGFGDEDEAALSKLRRVWGDGGHDLQLVLLGVGRPEDFGGLDERKGQSPLLATATEWTSRTPLVPTDHLKIRKHEKRDPDTHQAAITRELERIVRKELSRRAWLAHLADVVKIERIPHTFVGGTQTTWLKFRRVRNKGNGARSTGLGYGFKLTFPEPVQGPIALGYGCHYGLGTFVPRT